MARRLLKHVSVEALADRERRKPKTQTNMGCEMEALLLIAFVISMFGDGGGKAGW
ncbi:MAG TPA: hypothetical protein VE326_10085 [Candidatus Binatia bacterium]|nr:hypothetical protein [Candidatus Binatia bacterium]